MAVGAFAEHPAPVHPYETFVLALPVSGLGCAQRLHRAWVVTEAPRVTAG